MKTHLTLYITGQVQGVSFRQATKNLAEGLGVTGYIRNNLDGSITLEAEGTPQALDELVRWSKIGPRRAKVLHVEVEPGGLQHYTSFTTD